MDEAAKETVIIVHGTYAAPQPGASRWYQPTEGFIAKLDAALQERGSPARCWAHCTQGDPIFQWSGENSWIARTHAASALGDYVAKLRKEDWCCHIVAHSHGGNVVLEALPQIAATLAIECEVEGGGKPSVTIGPPLGKIVTLGTPFMDTMSPILQRIGRNQSFLTGLSWMIAGIIGIAGTAYVWFDWSLFWFRESHLGRALLESHIGRALLDAFRALMDGFELTFSSGALLGSLIIFFAAAIVCALLFFSRKAQDVKPIFTKVAQMQPKFLAIGSPTDEPWQLLHHMRTYPDPMAVKTNLIRYLILSMRSHISLSGQVTRIYGRKSYRDLNLAAKEVLAFMHLLFLLFVGAFIFYITGISFASGPTLQGIEWLGIFAIGWSVVLLLYTDQFGTPFFSAFFSPFRWCKYRVAAVIGTVRAIGTYLVRSRAWSVVLAIAMGLEGYRYYRYSFPRIEQYPSSVPGNFVRYEDMPKAAEQRALAKRNAWIGRHFGDVSQTFSKMVVTAADVALLLRTVEADQSLVHAAYYTEDECIARIADWIAGRG
jgi:hypothetical protein